MNEPVFQSSSKLEKYGRSSKCGLDMNANITNIDFGTCKSYLHFETVCFFSP